MQKDEKKRDQWQEKSHGRKSDCKICVNENGSIDFENAGHLWCCTVPAVWSCPTTFGMYDLCIDYGRGFGSIGRYYCYVESQEVFNFFVLADNIAMLKVKKFLTFLVAGSSWRVESTTSGSTAK